MVIDTHQHVFWHRRDDAGLIADMDEQGIDLAWLLTWEIPPGQENPNHLHRTLNPLHRRDDGSHRGIVLEDLVKTRDRYPDRFEIGYCPNPLAGDPAALFEAAHDMHGVRVCGEWKFRMLFEDPRCLNLFRKAGELNCPVVLHLDVPYLPDPETGKPVYQPMWYGGRVDNLARALEACPDTIFIGHAPGFWREISGDADQAPSNYPQGPIREGGRLFNLFERYPNLYADLSAGSARRALDRDHEFSQQFLERFADRLLFARDIYGGDLRQFLDKLSLSDSVRQKLMQDNAKRLLAGTHRR